MNYHCFILLCGLWIFACLFTFVEFWDWLDERRYKEKSGMCARRERRKFLAGLFVVVGLPLWWYWPLVLTVINSWEWEQWESQIGSILWL